MKKPTDFKPGDRVILPCMGTVTRINARSVRVSLDELADLTVHPIMLSKAFDDKDSEKARRLLEDEL